MLSKKFVGTQLKNAIYPVKASECSLVTEDTNIHPVCLKYNSEHIKSEDEESATFSQNPSHLHLDRVDLEP